jgi:LacI family transcriptional regulator
LGTFPSYGRQNSHKGLSVVRTLVEVAELAGVSRSTVSRVLNDHPSVSPEVRERVQEVIARTGYRPNAAARSLRSHRTKVMGLVIPQSVHTLFSDPYFPRLTEGVAQACNQHEYTLTLFIEFHEEALLPRLTRTSLLDGLVIQAARIESTLIEGLVRSDVPFVVVGRPSVASDVSYIDVDNINGAYTAVSHLIRLGRRRIATITGGSDSAAGLDRLQGYENALRDRGLQVDPDLIVEGDFTGESGYYGAQHLLQREPDAIFAASDAMAYGALRAIREAGLAVPGDLALIGFDDLPPAGIDPAFLTTVRQPIRSFGFTAVETLMDILHFGPRPPRRIIMPTELVVRQSCGSTGPGKAWTLDLPRPPRAMAEETTIGLQ